MNRYVYDNDNHDDRSDDNYHGVESDYFDAVVVDVTVMV